MRQQVHRRTPLRRPEKPACISAASSSRPARVGCDPLARSASRGNVSARYSMDGDRFRDGEIAIDQQRHPAGWRHGPDLIFSCQPWPFSNTCCSCSNRNWRNASRRARAGATSSLNTFLLAIMSFTKTCLFMAKGAALPGALRNLVPALAAAAGVCSSTIC